MQKYFKNFWDLFMGQSPCWYKITIVLFLFCNLICYYFLGLFLTGWLILTEFLFILAFALKAYPLFPGGLLALQALLLKMTSSAKVIKEITSNIDVIMLLMFMVPAIFFMKPFLFWIFTRIFINIRGKIALSLIFLTAGAFLSAWLDALTVIAVIITVCAAMKDLSEYIKINVSGGTEEFDGFLRNLCMHAAIGTALGGVATLIGEPQNLLIGRYTGWGFQKFYTSMTHFSIPLQIAGILTCYGLERFRLKIFGFGYQLSDRTITVLREHFLRESYEKENSRKVFLIISAILFAGLMLALGFQIAPIGIIGLGLLICLPILTGQIDEHKIGKAFTESMPFAALLIVFFVIVAMIESLGLFHSVVSWALNFSQKGQLYSFFTATGILSAISDNVFVAAVYIHQAVNAFTQGIIDKAQFERLAIIINMGTNIFSIVTPNGQAAFLFLLTSALARRIKLSYARMLLMSLPYAVILIITAVLCIR